jgi:predicted amidophosphoribosyltransferase
VEDSSDGLEGSRPLRYRLCPRCVRAVPIRSTERYCINDGEWLLEACPLCGAAITNPYTRFCGCCGLEFARVIAESPALTAKESPE